MSKIRRLFVGVFEYIPAARWCFTLFVVSFISVVSIHKYIDLADTAVFSAFEIMFLTLTDIVNIVFVYLPLYLFIICGIMFGESFGAAEIVRFKSRRNWLSGKAAAYFINTILFFLAVIVINIVVCGSVFSFSDVWSSDFVGFRVMMGQPSSDFSSGPGPVIVTACLSLFLYYLFCGVVNMVISLISGDEAAGLLASLFIGIFSGLINMTVTSSGFLAQILRCGVFLILVVIVYILGIFIVGKQDLCSKRK